MIINNHHPESITVVIDNITYEIPAHSSIKTTAKSFSADCQLIHNQNISDQNGSFSVKMLRAVSEITAIIVDSKYIISEIKDDTVLDITNEIETYEKDDVCVLYHGIVVKNARIELTECYSPNANHLIGTRKLLLLSDADDFPIISPIIAVIRYNRLKKINSKRNLWNIVYDKTAFIP